ncbi:hypothetical protein U9M48_005883 [Paspalum notatum var. saurae]|uniref:Uncharacterized protein n=1 Tax=Paspalum notatum var. saurae TaxID=547442 RepID=A0AAQ3PMT4_PASNO
MELQHQYTISYAKAYRAKCTRGCCSPLELGFEAVPAATYRGLCDACGKDESNASFRSRALLLQLWSYERLAVGRPIVDHRGYEAQYYGQHDDDGPTMGTLWVCPRERTWANEQTRRTYPSFVVALDRLVAEDQFPVPRVIDRVTSQDHRLSRLGQPCSGTWVTKVEPYVQVWDNAHQDVVHPVAPHTDWWYETFLMWYRPRTRCHVTYRYAANYNQTPTMHYGGYEAATLLPRTSDCGG